MGPFDKADTMKRPIEKITLIEDVQTIGRIKLGKDAGLSQVNTQIITASRRVGIKMLKLW